MKQSVVMEDLVVQTKKETLVSRDNKGKCRVVQVEAIYNEEGIY